jgi:hypothetical protein
MVAAGPASDSTPTARPSATSGPTALAPGILSIIGAAVSAAAFFGDWGDYTPIALDDTTGGALALLSSIVVYLPPALIGGVAGLLLTGGLRDRAVAGVILTSGLLALSLPIGQMLFNAAHQFAGPTVPLLAAIAGGALLLAGGVWAATRRTSMA